MKDNVQVAVMFVVDADEDSDGKMQHPYIPYDLLADDDEEAAGNDSTVPIVNQNGKKDIETGAPSNEVCFICQNPKVMHKIADSADEEAKM